MLTSRRKSGRGDVPKVHAATKAAYSHADALAASLTSHYSDPAFQASGDCSQYIFLLVPAGMEADFTLPGVVF